MRVFRGFLFAVLTAVIGFGAPAMATTTTDSQATSQWTGKRGVNVLGYDPYWTDEKQRRFQWRHFAEIRKAGFDFVRVNLHSFKHMDEANRLNPEWLRKLDDIVREAPKAGLSVILDEHDFNDCANDLDLCRTKLTAFWSQVAPRYASAPNSVAFELLNEPHTKLDAPTWNAFFPELLALVRQTNPTRTVVVGPTRWNNFNELPTLKLPDDPNLLVTFHYYDPFHFTHQGASWTGADVQKLSGITWGSEADRAQLRADFEKVAAWAKENKRPILLGEFGAYDKSGTPEAMRIAYTSAIAREAERHGFAWGYWQFDSDFIAWDMKKDGWVEPIRSALLPAEPKR